MSTYVVGDIQGCYEELMSLLALVEYSSEDELWLAGDLVNRGPDNVSVLKFCMAERNCRVVLGNHDLHFLGIATGAARPRGSDTVQDILDWHACPDAIEWLRQQPLIHRYNDFVMVHAGIPPNWSIDDAESFASEVETLLAGSHYREFLAEMYGNEPSSWHPGLTGMPRLRLITNYLTRLRFCKPDGEIELTHKTDIAPPGYSPWFALPRPLHQGTTILFGHWAAINGITDQLDALALDTGCVWGRQLTAYRLEDGKRFSVPAGTSVSTPSNKAKP